MARASGRRAATAPLRQGRSTCRPRSVVIDGHPKFNNLAGVCELRGASCGQRRLRASRTRAKLLGRAARPVVPTSSLKAWARIAAGQEIRVDYDMG
eukprot:5658842-Prymnesium_polylepis.1